MGVLMAERTISWLLAQLWGINDSKALRHRNLVFPVEQRGHICNSVEVIFNCKRQMLWTSQTGCLSLLVWAPVTAQLQLEVWEGTAVNQQPQTVRSTSFALHEQPAFFMCADCEYATLWILYCTAVCARVHARACIMVSAGFPWVKLQPALIIHQPLLAPRQTQFSSTRDSWSKHRDSFDFTGVQCPNTHTHTKPLS